ncbi:hypothetical protein Pf1_02621 [Flavobacterium columnare]|nr:hypothetical protein Pf1_02621 [Flavobacterium columnare]
MQNFKAFHFFLFGTSALLVAQYTKNIKISLLFYTIALILYISALVKFYKEKK